MKTAAGRTLFEIVEYNMSDTAFLPVKKFLNDINGNVKILSLFKILYHKYIYLGVETIFDLVETLSLEELDKKGGKKRRTIRKRRSIKKKSKRRRL
jgi:hypothetical protein